MHPSITPIDEAVAAFAAGAILILLDSEDRENEGDFVVAAELVTPQAIHFMTREGRGQLCMPVLPDVAERLDLTPMVPDAGGDAPRFTIPIDYAGCHTGISPSERCLTIQSIIRPTSRAHDFCRPGHVFPLIARPQGVLERPGHTEASVDLARLAGLTPAGVLCEICSRDGMGMANRDELFELATEHGLLVVTIDDLIEFRRKQTRVATSVNTTAGVPAIAGL